MCVVHVRRTREYIRRYRLIVIITRWRCVNTHTHTRFSSGFLGYSTYTTRVSHLSARAVNYLTILQILFSIVKTPLVGRHDIHARASVCVCVNVRVCVMKSLPA